MLMGGSVVTSYPLHVYMWCMSWAMCSLEGNKDKQKFTATYVQSKAPCTEPGKSSYTLPAENTLSACHASCSARMELKPRPTCPDGLPVSAYLAFCRKVLVRYVRRKTKNSHLYIHMQGSLRGVGCSPRGDASWHATGENDQSPSGGTPRSMRAIPNERNI